MIIFFWIVRVATWIVAGIYTYDKMQPDTFGQVLLWLLAWHIATWIIQWVVVLIFGGIAALFDADV